MSSFGPYSKALRAGGFLFLSGQIGFNSQTQKLEEGFYNQTLRALKNAEAILESFGLSRHKVVKVVAYLTDMSAFEEFNIVYGEFFKDVEPKPVRSTVGVKELPLGALIELELTAFDG
ncbi:MAG: RidA family protein [Aquificaceae bacterium]|nr:RidA family protein [Aquificaceae bacterium]MDW8236914.1 RidA family protein [Aquificaceae bacterium]